MIKYTYLVVVLLMIASGFSSCNEAEEAQAAMDRKDTFFSLEKFFETEETRLQNQEVKIDKQIKINDQEEQKIIEHADFSREFSMFRKADINRPAWSDKYQADSLFENGILTNIHYKSLDPELKTQELSIDLDIRGIVEKITITSQTETALACNNNWMSYLPDEGYEIRTRQENRTAETLNIEIKGKFIKE